jgi:peptidyl-prolyl cis-trans isomerase C
VVIIDDLKPGDALGFEEVRERIFDYLELQARQCELQQYLRGLQQRYGVRGLGEIEAEAT